MSNNNGFSTITAGVCFTLVGIIAYTALVFDLGHASGLREGSQGTVRPIVRQGDLPYNIPVMVYTIREDGTIDGESVLRTDYAGVLPYSTTGQRVPFDKLEKWDYWTELREVTP
jgi:hypothetical protein